jgi:hypothetical protein
MKSQNRRDAKKERKLTKRDNTNKRLARVFYYYFESMKITNMNMFDSIEYNTTEVSPPASQYKTLPGL